jgi:CRP/FNR family transcriptional regulator, dissimilatory nitrate respiration regulator
LHADAGLHVIRIMLDIIAFIERLCGPVLKPAREHVLFRRGDPVSVLYLVETGDVSLERTTAAGLRLILQRATAGDILAEASIFATHYHCDALASASAAYRKADMADVRRALDAESQAMRLLADHLARQAQRSRSRAEILSLRRIGDKVDAWLDLNGGILPAKGRWRELAAEVGVTPEALYRELSRRRSTASMRF